MQHWRAAFAALVILIGSALPAVAAEGAPSDDLPVPPDVSFSVGTRAWWTSGYSEFMQRFEGKTPREPSALMNADPALFGWTWANALSFVEEANFGEPDKQDETTRESNMHRRAATFGLEHAGMSVSRGWNWYVPVARGLLSATGTEIVPFLLAGTDPPLETSQALLFCRLDPQTGEVIRE